MKLAKPLTTADVISERCGVRPLVVKASNIGNTDDWFALSRKHEIEVDARRRHVSIFGGKLTDCVNVGEEIAALLPALDVQAETPKARWYGEPGDDVKQAFLSRARIVLTGAGADGMLDEITTDPRAATPIIVGGPDLVCEARFAGRAEMVTTLMDYLRRRTKLALTIGTPAIAASPALPELCRLLFAEDAEARRDEFLAGLTPVPTPVRRRSSGRATTTQTATKTAAASAS